jgi:hypothetical protein
MSGAIATTLAYPESDLKVEGPNERTVACFAAHGCRSYAEIGVYKGYTARRIAEVLGGEGEIHLFDYADRVEQVAARLRAAGHRNVVAHGNSRRLLDSYNWSVMRVLAERKEPPFDYVFLDGAHTWAHDALAFLGAEELGGAVEEARRSEPAEPLLRGDELGIPPGREVGRLLELIEEERAAGTIATKEEALELVRRSLE